jgi:hypothetical protein
VAGTWPVAGYCSTVRLRGSYVRATPIQSFVRRSIAATRIRRRAQQSAEGRQGMICMVWLLCVYVLCWPGYRAVHSPLRPRSLAPQGAVAPAPASGASSALIPKARPAASVSISGAHRSHHVSSIQRDAETGCQFRMRGKFAKGNRNVAVFFELVYRQCQMVVRSDH